jgi:hypothetical protein
MTPLPASGRLWRSLSRSLFLFNAFFAIAISECSPYDGEHTSRIPVTDNCVAVSNAFFHDLTAVPDQGGAIYVSHPGVTSTITATTFSGCKASQSGGSCYLSSQTSELSECCFFSSFSSGDGQSVFINTTHHPAPGPACNSVTFLQCGRTDTVPGQRGTITMTQKDGSTSPSLQGCNFSSCAVQGTGGALELKHSEGAQEVRYCVIAQCAGGSLVYTERATNPTLLYCGFYNNLMNNE